MAEKQWLDIDADLIPGVGAAGMTLGQTVGALPALEMVDDVAIRIVHRVLVYGKGVGQSVRRWILAYDLNDQGIVMQILVYAGYRGKIDGKIGIGSRIADVEAAFGPVEDMGSEYQIDKGTPWLCNNWTFTVEKGSPAMGEPGWEDARIDSICIMPDD